MREHDLKVRNSIDMESFERVPEVVATGVVANGQLGTVLVTVEAETDEDAVAILLEAGFELA